jgi:CRP-like cAMP-binding protein
MPAAESALVKKLTRFISLGHSELTALAELEARRRRVAAGTELVHEHQAGHHAFILQEGWACAYKLLSDGGRQVIDFAIPGDVMGLRSVLLRTSDHSFSALTDVVVAEASARQLTDSSHELPRLGAAILWAATRDEAKVVEHLVSVGRRSAVERTAHLLLELGERLQLVGFGTERGYVCPLNQYLMADALGLTAIHVNRVLRHLREEGLVTFRDGHVVFHDLAGLRSLAGWHGGYLDQAPTARG